MHTGTAYGVVRCVAPYGVGAGAGGNARRLRHHTNDSHPQQALGHPISVISGHEEARLVYLGAAFDLSVSENQRLVVDIGGGSTEITIGKGYNPFLMDSLYIHMS